MTASSICILAGIGLLLTENIFNKGYTAILLTTLGVQIGFFGVYTKTYLATRYDEEPTWLGNLYNIFQIKHAVLLCFILLTGGVIALIHPAIVDSTGFTLFLVAMLAAFNSLYISELSLQ
jgi:multisubunit Na+/H+ antiporter MnhG subunit